MELKTSQNFRIVAENLPPKSLTLGSGRLVLLGLGLLAGLLRDLPGLLLDGRVRVLHDRLVRLLGVGLRLCWV